jgi:hypothetical protein
MSVTFTKLFSSICESTVWMEPHGTRIAWVTMLAMADRKGRIFAALPGLANRARITLDEAKLAVATFLAPDEYSRTKDFDGRRIVEIDGGWQLLNYAKYRAIRDEETTRESKREHMQRVRSAAKSGSENSTVERGGDKQKQKQKQKQVKKEKPGGSAPPPHPRDGGVPYVAIRDLYNAAMTDLASCRVLGAKRETLIRKAWNTQPEWQSLAFWKAYFAECQENKFLNGTGPYGKGHEDWRPDFDYLMRPDVVTRVYEKAMDRMERGE